MPKLDKEYLTIWRNVVPSLSLAKPFYNPNYDYNWVLWQHATYPALFNQLKGAFQPLADIGKDAADTFKPYRSRKYAFRDLKQPFYGIGNVLKGVACLVLFVPLFFYNFFRFLVNYESRNVGYSVLGALGVSAVRSVSYLTEGVLRVIRGLTQIAFTPFALIKMLIRAAITAYYDFNDDPKEKDFLLAENRPGIQALVTKAYQHDGDKTNICYEIYRKYNKAIKWGEGSKIKDKMEKIHAVPSGSETKSYLALFQLDPTLKEEKSDKQEPGVFEGIDKLVNQ